MWLEERIKGHSQMFWKSINQSVWTKGYYHLVRAKWGHEQHLGISRASESQVKPVSLGMSMTAELAGNREGQGIPYEQNPSPLWGGLMIHIPIPIS